MSSDVKVAESAFVGAVAHVIKLEVQMLELREQLQQADARAEHANQAALRELGFNEDTSPDEIFDAQERFLKLAIDRAQIDRDGEVARAVLAQIRQARNNYNDALLARASQEPPL